MLLTGKEWESPENLALNKEQPHAYFFPFQHLDNARKVLPENSKFWQSLDGDWKFHWAPDPRLLPAPKISIRLSMMSAHGMRFRAFKLEYLWHSKGRKPEVRNAYLRQPTGNLPAQREGG